jgi:hypothetical protein
MTAMFELGDGGIGVMPDPADNPAGHVVPHSGAGLQISFEVANVGDASGQARVGVEVDDDFRAEWLSEDRAPGETAFGRVDLGRLSPGDHVILAYVNPGSGSRDNQTNAINLP